jgi:hypothetical protein
VPLARFFTVTLVPFELATGAVILTLPVVPS